MNKTLSGIVLLALVGLVAAQDTEKKATSSSSSGMLHPELAVAAGDGSYSQPAGTLGQKTSAPWSDTTIAAGVDKKPEPGREVTITGEVIDLSCYLQLGKHGDKHKSCGTKCLQAGEPIGLLARNGTVYILMEEEHDPRRDGQATLRQAAIENFGKIMEVTGTEAAHAGIRAIYVEGYLKK